MRDHFITKESGFAIIYLEHGHAHCFASGFESEAEAEDFLMKEKQDDYAFKMTDTFFLVRSIFLRVEFKD